jgi:hypothetical protein
MLVRLARRVRRPWLMALLGQLNQPVTIFAETAHGRQFSPPEKAFKRDGAKDREPVPWAPGVPIAKNPLVD